MKGFKLIAIKPLKGCDNRFLKNLKTNEIYKFYNDFSFDLNEEENKVVEIRYRASIPENLYGKHINISAVVGKNGSGKSTIVELFSLFVFCLSVQLDLININNFKKSHKLHIKDQEKLDKELKNFKSFQCQLYYSIDHNIYSLTKTNSGFELLTFEKTVANNKHGSIFKPNAENSINTISLKQDSDNIKFLRNFFFYSILANYSLYGLNTNETGIWLKSIFHKNDGYQTPIVLNPMRTEGKIDINRLTYLSKSRLLGNVFMPLEDKQEEQNSLRNLVNGKIVNKLILNLDFQKFETIGEEGLKPDQFATNLLLIDDKSIYLEFTGRFKKTHFHALIEAFYPKYDFGNSQFNNSKIKTLTIEYVLKKAHDIVKKYPQFKTFKNSAFRTNSKKETIKKCFERLAADFTHSTFKIRQALNFLIHDFYEFENNTKKEFLISTSTKLGIADKINSAITKMISDNLNDLNVTSKINLDVIDLAEGEDKIYRRFNLTYYLPPSFFEIDFEFKEKGFFKDLSSGEKQMIYSINSVIYHLTNLDSISSTNFDEGVSYQNFNIILDEIELYFHPEFQRIYIKELIKSINYIKKDNYSINIIFLTHSPFILSDIPTSNILRLEDGTIENIKEETYAANVHDLLANDFFLKNGFMGEFAKEKIKDLLRYLTFDESSEENETNEKPRFPWNSNQAEDFIEIIGEPLLKYDLKELYLSKFYNEKRIDNEIERLQELKKRKKDL